MQIKKKDAIKMLGGNASNLAKVLGVSRQAVNQWGEYIPPLRAYQLKDLKVITKQQQQ
jgi:DNA-binding transcriptional regulator YdaS (Cro superfamily)